MSEKTLFEKKIERAILVQTITITISYVFAIFALVEMLSMIQTSDDLKVYKSIVTINQTLFLMSPKLVLMVMFLSSLTVATKAANRTKDYIEMLKP